MLNDVIVTGRVSKVFINNSNGRNLIQINVKVQDPERCTEDGNPYAYTFSVTLSGALATRLKDKLVEGLSVCVKGRFEPTTSPEGKQYYNINASSCEVIDAGSMNHAVLQGRLTHDVELRYTNAGNAATSVALAVGRNYKDTDGTWHNTTSFITVSAFNEIAEEISKYKKGKMLWIVGSLAKSKWTDKNGTDHYPVSVLATAVYDGGTGKYNQNDQNIPAAANSSISPTAPESTVSENTGSQYAPSDPSADSLADPLYGDGFGSISDDELPF